VDTHQAGEHPWCARRSRSARRSWACAWALRC
jgi:hypothetical protein